MKKLLGILGACVMTASSAGSVIACDNGGHHEVTSASISAAKFVSDTQIDAMMSGSMADQKMVTADFKITPVSSALSGADYSISKATIDSTNNALVHLTIEAGHSAEHLALSYRNGNKVNIQSVQSPAAVQSASFENDTKIDLVMSKPVKDDQVTIADFKITAGSSLLLADGDYAITKVTIDASNDTLVYLTIASGHSAESNLFVSYKDEKKVEISPIGSPAEAVSAGFSSDTKIKVAMSKPVKSSEFKLSDFVISGGDGKIQISAADVDSTSSTFVVLTVSAGYSVDEDLQLDYKSAPSWISISPIPAQAVSAIFDDDDLINITMNRMPSVIKASDFTIFVGATSTQLAINGLKVDEKNPNLVHLTVDDGHDRDKDLKLVYDFIDNQDKLIAVSPIPPSVAKTAIFVGLKKIDVTMDRKVIAGDFVAKDFTIKSAGKDAIAVTSATIDAKNPKIVHLVIDKDGHSSDKDLQLVYKSASDTVNISPEAPATVASAWFDSDTAITVYMSREVMQKEIDAKYFTIKDAKGTTHAVKTATCDNSDVVKLTIDKADSTAFGTKLLFDDGKTKASIDVTPNIPLVAKTAKYSDARKVVVNMNIPVRNIADIKATDFKMAWDDTSGKKGDIEVRDAKISDTASDQIILTVSYWDAYNIISLTYKDQAKINVATLF